MGGTIPSVEASERGRIAFTTHNLDEPVQAAGGGWKIAAINANGTDFQRITSSSHTVSGFTWSPNGSRIAYTLSIYRGYTEIFGQPREYESLADLLQAQAEMQQKMLELANDPEKMQRSQRIDTQLCLINADGSGEGYFEDFYATQMAWSPDGTQFALIVPDGTGEALAIMNVDGSDLRHVCAISRVSLGGWSSDGRRLLLGGDQLYTIQLDGTDRQDFAVGDLRPLYAVYSPDGQRFSFIGFGEDRAALYVIDVDGSNLRELVPLDEAADGLPYCWSPDGQQIAYVAFPPDRKNYTEHETLWVLAVDGSAAPRKLAEIYGNVFHDELRVSAPAWSPDGKRIAYLAFYDPNMSSFDIYLINPDGSDLRRVTTDGLLKMNLAWQPEI